MGQTALASSGDSGIDPAEYDTLSQFKHAVYDEHGTGSWIADAKLEVIWREAHDKGIPDHLQPLLKEAE